MFTRIFRYIVVVLICTGVLTIVVVLTCTGVLTEGKYCTFIRSLVDGSTGVVRVKYHGAEPSRSSLVLGLRIIVLPSPLTNGVQSPDTAPKTGTFLSV